MPLWAFDYSSSLRSGRRNWTGHWPLRVLPSWPDSSGKCRIVTNYRLLLPQNLWARVWSDLSLGQQRLAWGRAFRSEGPGQCCELIVRTLNFSNTIPDAREYSLLHDFFVFDAPGAHAIDQLPNLFAQMQLRDRQLLVYLQPAFTATAGTWIGVVYRQGQLTPLRAIHLVGAGMLRFSRSSVRSKPLVGSDRPAATTAAADSSAWSRLTGVLGEGAFQRFRDREILLVGCGRLGSLLAAALVRMGLRKLTIVDPDRLELHNRDATVGNTPRDHRQPKVTVLLRHLHRIRPAARLQGLIMRLEDPRVVPAIRRCAAMFLCVDNDDARLYAAHVASQLLRITLDCGTLIRRDTTARADSGPILSADIRLILPGGCLKCIGGLSPTARIAGGSEPTAGVWTDGGRIGSLPSLNHLAAGIALQLWLDLLSERVQTSWWHRLQWIPGEGLRTDSAPLHGNDHCTICGTVE